MDDKVRTGKKRKIEQSSSIGELIGEIFECDFLLDNGLRLSEVVQQNAVVKLLLGNDKLMVTEETDLGKVTFEFGHEKSSYKLTIVIFQREKMCSYKEFWLEGDNNSDMWGVKSEEFRVECDKGMSNMREIKMKDYCKIKLTSEVSEKIMNFENKSTVYTHKKEYRVYITKTKLFHEIDDGLLILDIKRFPLLNSYGFVDLEGFTSPVRKISREKKYEKFSGGHIMERMKEELSLVMFPTKYGVLYIEKNICCDEAYSVEYHDCKLERLINEKLKNIFRGSCIMSKKKYVKFTSCGKEKIDYDNYWPLKMWVEKMEKDALMAVILNLEIPEIVAHIIIRYLENSQMRVLDGRYIQNKKKKNVPPRKLERILEEGCLEMDDNF